MPIYEYECGGCGHLWEEEQKMNDLPISKCPKCKKNKSKRLISDTSFVLKGGGWAKEGYKSIK